jgi:hypothetical protein
MICGLCKQEKPLPRAYLGGVTESDIELVVNYGERGVNGQAEVCQDCWQALIDRGFVSIRKTGSRFTATTCF